MYGLADVFGRAVHGMSAEALDDTTLEEGELIAFDEEDRLDDEVLVMVSSDLYVEGRHCGTPSFRVEVLAEAGLKSFPLLVVLRFLHGRTPVKKEGEAEALSLKRSLVGETVPPRLEVTSRRFR